MSASAKRPTSSLTPQRKHRKLMKDGSGIEVWPESIEKIFVQGLHEYWKSPWATYSQSRGRSRWRNQFLVDYLQKAGIDRSKKQVASHIQVLRNMWKGEPGFYLVAGGEEPPPDTPVKMEDGSLISLDFDETDGSSNSTLSDFSPPELQCDFPPSPGHVPGGYAIGSNSPPSKGSISPYASPALYTTSMPSSMSIYPIDIGIQPHSHDHSPIQNTHHNLSASHNHAADAHSSLKLNTSHSDSDGVSDIYAYSYPQSPSRVTSICLWTDGMAPLSIKLDSLMSPHSSLRMPLAIELRINIAPDDAARGTSSREAIPTRITQEVIADDETVLYLIYNLDRSMGPMPSAKLMRWMPMAKSAPSAPPGVHSPLTSPVYHGYPTSSFSAFTPTSPSLSSALTPVNHTRHAASTFSF
ncbi:hypothetical protein C0993_004023 [Termitomyces sp. T159_Od127]|nr:hypothetical protein C0993_004023 [Termitomyces sp. T159_Od127]